eukprot:CAMPEP_0113434428 /NCGR_PEP_ID=MMETSP0013_2-20120614/35588_1 /TAXON_ID=2843 ORGANISM="Skeletonema costatum, Strain 1716" /NCGR_SAMPLE_ID=MMETSP0013_2 /ASSEMBLY_ACC=CAM_ASM_000158 /LENGTH=36 /DNA_ID=CAMNT_0000324437 /DNA_START=80 /DNA_END=187 /DNA_ORIENTATION=- /assembly_acc=CAM_ASM_000158
MQLLIGPFCGEEVGGGVGVEVFDAGVSDGVFDVLKD